MKHSVSTNSTMPQLFGTAVARLQFRQYECRIAGGAGGLYLRVSATSTPRTTASTAGAAHGEAASSTSAAAARSNVAGQDDARSPAPAAALSAEGSSSTPRATARERARRPGSTRSSAGSAASHGRSAASSRARRYSARTIGD